MVDLYPGARADPPILPPVRAAPPTGKTAVTGPPVLPTVRATPHSPNAVQVDPPLLPTVRVSHAGPTGLPAGGGGAGATEVYIQAASPTQGATPWVWYETTALGDLTGNEYVWKP